MFYSAGNLKGFDVWNMEQFFKIIFAYIGIGLSLGILSALVFGLVKRFRKNPVFFDNVVDENDGINILNLSCIVFWPMLIIVIPVLLVYFITKGPNE